MSGGARAAIGSAVGLLVLVLLTTVHRHGVAGLPVYFEPLGLFGAVFTVYAALVLRQRPGHRVGWLLLTQGLLGAITSGAMAVRAPAADRLEQVTWFPVYAILPIVLLCVLPGEPGVLRRRSCAVLSVVVVAGTAALAASVAMMSDEELARDLVPANPVARILSGVALVAVVLCGLAMLAEVVVMARWALSAARGPTGLFRCLGVAAAVTLLSVLLDFLDVAGAWLLGILAVPAALLWAAFSERLFDIDLLVNRAVASMLGWAGLIALYALTVEMARRYLGEAGPSRSVTVATVIVGVAAAPAFSLARRGIDRVLYGHRCDPLTVLSQAGQPVSAGNPDTPTDDVLRAIAVGITIGMAIPYVRLTLIDGTTVETGRAACGPVETFEMHHQGCRLGTLEAAGRSYHGRFSKQDRRVLAALADQASVAIHAMLVAHQLAEARARLVAARETERLQLRNDLHDGLGPALSGVAMQLRALRGRCDEPLREAVEATERDLACCAAEIRSVVQRLRPPALLDGLIPAVGEAAARLERAGTQVVFDHPATLRPVEPAVEMAAYRIICEALTNAVRHGKARCCTITIVDESALVLDVSDDGIGFDRTVPDDMSCGVGLESMRERAAEVGGVLEVLPVDPHGTRVRAVLSRGLR